MDHDSITTISSSPLQGQTKEQAFLGQMNQELKNNTDAFLPVAVS